MAHDAALTQLAELALDCGFSHSGRLAIQTLVIRSQVRDACAADKCRAYGKNWSCPPACGTLEECERRIRQYRAGLVLQTTGRLEDSFDYEAMTELAARHNGCLAAFQEKLQPVTGASFPPPFLLLGSGGCRICESCTCPESPCRFPGRMIISMEAMGLQVSEVCAANGLPYYYGPATLTYVGCVLI
ncbi:MAG: DUF2284 domain-containing protein [Treponema sp.]|nr:DUF2284 domain-containing protein [Treponema sp.]